MAQLRVPVFFDISRYLTGKYFDIAWGCHLPGTPQIDPPKNQFFELLKLGCQCFMISADIYQINIFTWFEVPPPQGPPNGPKKINFLNDPS